MKLMQNKYDNSNAINKNLADRSMKKIGFTDMVRKNTKLTEDYYRANNRAEYDAGVAHYKVIQELCENRAIMQKKIHGSDSWQYKRAMQICKENVAAYGDYRVAKMPDGSFRVVKTSENGYITTDGTNTTRTYVPKRQTGAHNIYGQ